MLNLIVTDPFNPQLVEQAKALAEKWGFNFTPTQQGLALELSEHLLGLKQLDDPKLGEVYVDFSSDALTFRRLHGGGKKEAIAKAIGLKGTQIPRVLDATAGLGRDAFVLASLGCQVDLIERSPVVAALLADGLIRASQQPDLMDWLPNQMTLHHGIAVELLNNWQGTIPDVVYLDPMFPHRKKSALVKKEMRLFQQLLGPDEDADLLLAPALKLAAKRVVVKRPDSAPFLSNQQPSMAITGKKHRFDVYMTNL
ncbi:class I SAM-dependent methyltransferase [Aliiglaciecola sp. LCG003]|uniref:class I SAM-dependent methyltransferase n=1 Tax=Aliiglaciecola sp. LCG003 TaxID=3053655 RepID=UPI002573F24C|nr:class I SAM-dependent methyltransferase [Aliiglaciecola sp. LCG003]WJG09588.1 class I SAM-dependent methyltransferase [Aliiglaciecola sp. LCG003]